MLLILSLIALLAGCAVCSPVQAPFRKYSDLDDMNTSLISFADNGKLPISIFTYYLRDNYEFINNFTSTVSSNVVIFIPTDSAVASLSQKPWQFPTQIDESLPEQQKDEISKANILSFVKSHLVPLGKASIKDIITNKYTNLNGKPVYLKSEAGKLAVSTDESSWAKVINYKSELIGGGHGNSVVYMAIDGTLDKPAN